MSANTPPNSPAQQLRLVWFDTEYTDLNLEGARILQIAAAVTDADLRRVHPAEEDLCMPVRLAGDTPVSPWVAEHLAPLLAACRGPEAVSLAEAEAALLGLLDRAAAATEGPVEFVLAGNSVHADWWLARRDLPRFIARLHYRQLDVTAFKLEWRERRPAELFEKDNPGMVRAWFPDARLDGVVQHDARYDIQASIAELAFYRSRLLRPR
jgi:oligoribonuclease